jgi:hypothetical protein
MPEGLAPSGSWLRLQARDDALLARQITPERGGR